MDDAVVEKTYTALLGVVQTTALSRKVLQRPPFTFLHKLLVETLAVYDIFSSQQLAFAELVTKEDKAAFLTRAIAFVAFVMARIHRERISCLLLVSPIKVLAGVAVDDTHEFLLQLCDVCASSDRDAKAAAAHDVLAKGDAQLYTSGVSFRKGLLLVQTIVRSFIQRRANKRKALTTGAAATGAGATNALLQPMAHGTRFLKELADGRVYDGVILDVTNAIYVLGYEQDPAARDEVDEIEMKIIMEESQRLSLSRKRMTLSAKSASADDDDISLIGLPDLSQPELLDKPLKPKLVKRVVSRDAAAQLTPSRSKPALTRSQSHQLQSGTQSQASLSASVRLGGTDADQLMAGAVCTPATGSGTSKQGLGKSSTTTLHQQTPEVSEDPSDNNSSSKEQERAWQVSLKRMLASGQHTELHAGLPNAATPLRKPNALETLSAADAAGPSRHLSNNAVQLPPVVVSFPKLGIPGTKSLAPLSTAKKRLHSDKTVATLATTEPSTSSSKAAATDAKRLNKSTSQQLHSSSPSPSGPTLSTTSQTLRSAASTRTAQSSASAYAWSVASGTTSGSAGDVALDAAFTGTSYQPTTTDVKTQEKLTLFREIVRRIDAYMKRKHLRVIDLFRFCDADGNGSISPIEMIDTLSQMEIQLAPDEAQAFITYIDKDGNGSIDIDEFEELVRVARRNEAQREQFRKELSHTKKAQPVEPKPVGKFSAFTKHRQRICDEFKTADVSDVSALSVAQLRSLLLRLDIPGADEQLIDSLIERALALGSSSSAVTSGSSASTSHQKATMIIASGTAATSPSVAAGASCMVSYQQLCRSLDDLAGTKKANRFLDQSWLAHFDSQMERAQREFELL